MECPGYSLRHAHMSLSRHLAAGGRFTPAGTRTSALHSHIFTACRRHVQTQTENFSIYKVKRTSPQLTDRHTDTQITPQVSLTRETEGSGSKALGWYALNPRPADLVLCVEPPSVKNASHRGNSAPPRCTAENLPNRAPQHLAAACFLARFGVKSRSHEPDFPCD